MAVLILSVNVLFLGLGICLGCELGYYHGRFSGRR